MYNTNMCVCNACVLKMQSEQKLKTQKKTSTSILTLTRDAPAVFIPIMCTHSFIVEIVHL